MTKTITKTRAPAKKAATKAPAKAKVVKDPDIIAEAKPVASGGDYTFIKSNGGEQLILPNDRVVGQTAKLAVMGGSFKALTEHWNKQSVAKLARGVDARSAPQSAKAVADSAAKAKPAKAAPAKAAATAKKAERAEAKAKAANPDRPYKVLVKFADTGIRPGTWTTFMVESILAHKSTAAANAATQARRDREFGGKKLDFKWVADVKKFIQFTD